MKRILFSITVIVVAFSCKKGHMCTNNNNQQKGITKEFSIIGRWRLTATASYSAPRGQSSWQPAGLPASRDTIIFSKDSVFSYSDFYLHKEQGYDRYKLVDSADFYVYATHIPQGGNFPIYHGSVTAQDDNTLVFRYMGVDAGLLEMYTRD